MSKTRLFLRNVGFRFYLTDTGKVIRRLRTSNKKRWKRRLKKYKEEYRSGEKSFEEIKRSMTSYRGHLKHGHTWKHQKKMLKSFVLIHSPKNEPAETIRIYGQSLPGNDYRNSRNGES